MKTSFRFSRLGFARRSLRHHWRVSSAVLLGVALSTAVLTGAFIVGDSVRGSLRMLTLDRLQAIDYVLTGDQFIRPEMVPAARDGSYPPAVVPAILMPHVTAETSLGRRRRSRGVMVVGSDGDFWELGIHPPSRVPNNEEIILNEPLAAALQAKVGDAVTLRLPSSENVPADSPLGRRDDVVRSLPNLKVIEIIPARGLGRFRLRSSQHTPHNAYVSLAALQRTLNEPDRVNTVFAVARGGADKGEKHSHPPGPLQPQLSDFGIRRTRGRLEFADTDVTSVIYDYHVYATDRLIWSDELAEKLRTRCVDSGLNDETQLGGQEVFTYLATSITRVGTDQNIPYSMVAAIDEATMAAVLVDADGNALDHPGENEIVLNSWAADDLGAEIGDEIELEYFAPETTHGQPVAERARFRLKTIVPVTQPSVAPRGNRPAEFTQRPSPANDPYLTPTVEGITDENSIRDWDPPFPYDPKRIRRQDDEYWDFYRTTPKAFITLADGRRLWGSRFGNVTMFRVPANKMSGEKLDGLLLGDLQDLAKKKFPFIPVKQQALDASAGTTPFEGLFLGFSMFLIVSALMLVALLFRLGLELRKREVGLLLAVGWDHNQVRRTLLLEALIVAVMGAVLGTLAGIGFSWLMLTGLRTWWVAAIVTPFLELRITPRAIALGMICSLLVCLAVIAVSARSFARMAPQALLSGATTSTTASQRKIRRWPPIVAIGLAATGLVLGLLATGLTGEAQAGAFFGCGALVLTAGLLVISHWLRWASQARPSTQRLSLTGLAARAAARHPLRSALTIGLMASACFLIVAISAFRLAPNTTGTGGFDLLAQSDRPIFTDFGNAAAVKNEFGGTEINIGETIVLPLRIQEGDDASCRNLYQASQPQLLGVSQRLMEYFDQTDGDKFGWAATKKSKSNPWRLLQSSEAPDEVPVIIDKNTALYSLKLYGGVGQTFEKTYDNGVTIKFRVIGLLANSVLQGSLIVDEDQLVRYFPGNSGYRYFLIRSAPGQSDQLAATLEDRFADQGFDVQRSTDVLTNLLAVQNTYLSTFQSLGALGLLFGTIGLAIVQMRSIVERRGELALLKTTGFAGARLAEMILLENATLVLVGLGLGVLAALLAVVPHMLAGGAAVPWLSLAWMLGLILLVGLLASLFTIRPALSSSIMPALRGD